MLDSNLILCMLYRWELWWTVLPLAFALTGTTGTLRRT